MRRNVLGAALVALAAASAPCRAGEPFAFGVLTDLHAGTGTRDFGTPGFDDTLERLPDAPWAAAGREAVRKLNALKGRVKFVFVTGDLTDTAERSEFLAAKRILDELEMPYIPLMGNHDVWPFTGPKLDLDPIGGDEADAPEGDRYFEETFRDSFERAAAALPDLARAPRPTPSPKGKPVHFQNVAFTSGGYGFVGLDWNNRGHLPGGWEGAPANAQLFDFAGGTYRWLEGLIGSGWAARQKRVFLFQHHPFRSLVPDWAFTFSKAEKGRLRELLAKGPFWGVFAGHLHYAQAGPAFDEDPRPPKDPAGPALAELRDAAGSLADEPPALGPLRWTPGRDPRFQQVVTAAAATTAQVTVVEITEDGDVLVGRY